ncbi:MAG: acetolactate synthase small subunit [Syntrophales bacterium]|nr:acetolactate synthase small subunit [Syntrophales bacterium]MCK9527907.1 acetolactate synthase small subunit [Syntrophales bacterium]MDX9921917.1 acetolactate synthase small subunit [Syntrophales bacterium]
MKSEVREHVISMLVNNRPGVLSRVAGVFGRLGYNIESLCVAETISPNVSRITSVSKVDPNFMEKVRKQLDRLVDVLSVTVLDDSHSVKREMMLMGLPVTTKNRSDLFRAVDMFGCTVVSMKDSYCILQIVGTRMEVETALHFLKPLGVKDIASTGAVALESGASGTS